MTLVKLDSGDYINTSNACEIWKPIPTFDGVYEASSTGKIRSLNRIVFHTSRWGKRQSQPISGKVLKPELTKAGYLQVSLSTAGKHRQYSVHGLVAAAFLGLRPKGFQVNHKDENRTNNFVSNLEYVTPKQNNNYGNHNLRISIRKGHPVVSISSNGRKEMFVSINEAQRKTGIHESNIRKCIRGERRTAGGLCWELADIKLDVALS